MPNFAEREKGEENTKEGKCDPTGKAENVSQKTRVGAKARWAQESCREGKSWNF